MNFVVVNTHINEEIGKQVKNANVIFSECISFQVFNVKVEALEAFPSGKNVNHYFFNQVKH